MSLEEQLQQLHLQAEQHFQEREELVRIHMEHQHAIQTLTMEKEELVRTHTLESGELRKKVSILTEKLEAAASQPMSVAPSSSSYAEFTADMDNLSMHYEGWDNFVNDPFAEEAAPQAQQPAQQTALVISPKKKGPMFAHSGSQDAEKPVASGLLLMLLLCGAFVASKSSGNSAPVIPPMSDEVRAASATVLDSILNDAGAPAAATINQNIIISQVGGASQLPAGINWPSGKTTLSGAEFASIAPDASSAIDNFNNFVGPSKDQEAEQAFSMTASQYNSLTSADFNRQFYGTPPRSPESNSPASQSLHRRNLAEALAAMREESKGERASDIFTKSLLFDHIRPEIVAEFKTMIAESRRLDDDDKEMKTET